MIDVNFTVTILSVASQAFRGVKKRKSYDRFDNKLTYIPGVNKQNYLFCILFFLDANFGYCKYEFTKSTKFIQILKINKREKVFIKLWVPV